MPNAYHQKNPLKGMSSDIIATSSSSKRGDERHIDGRMIIVGDDPT